MGSNLTRLNDDPPVETEDLKVLLLGAGDSGKSTFFKQIKILFHNGFSRDEREAYREVIWGIVLKAMKALVAASRMLDIPVEREENISRASRIFEMDTEVLINIMRVWNDTLASDIKELWRDPGIQKTFKHRHLFQLDETSPYYFEALNRVGVWDYVPTEEDVLKSRVKTTGIVESSFVSGNKHIIITDTGGQRNERKKWIHCFDGVTTIMFFINLAEYEMKCYEDDETNRMLESLQLFEEVVNSARFKNTPIILVLNKMDLLREVIKTRPLSNLFRDYKDGNNPDAAIDHIRRKYEQKNRSERPIYTVLTNSSGRLKLDTNIVRETFRNISGIVLNNPDHRFKPLPWLYNTKVYPTIHKKIKFADITFYFYEDYNQHNHHHAYSSTTRTLHSRCSSQKTNPPKLIIDKLMDSPSRIALKMSTHSVLTPTQPSKRAFKALRRKLKKFDSMPDVKKLFWSTSPSERRALSNVQEQEVFFRTIKKRGEFCQLSVSTPLNDDNIMTSSSDTESAFDEEMSCTTDYQITPRKTPRALKEDVRSNVQTPRDSHEVCKSKESDDEMRDVHSLEQNVNWVAPQENICCNRCNRCATLTWSLVSPRSGCEIEINSVVEVRQTLLPMPSPRLSFKEKLVMFQMLERGLKKGSSNGS
ncbi:guanine nucleotide-binding protein subunit alpha [Acrasis kona]|uniref:Guanine nucleotide-binding protein subunit alpha n=1 Tax=Acrasis kona TaxID=1008807 RepID=A0AAW2YY03_9EUKA